VRQLSTGGTQVVLGRAANGVDGVLAAVPLALEAAPGELLQVRAEVTGTSPTTVRAKVWADGTSEPEDWAVSATDSTAKLQAPGGVGLRAYLSGSATNAPIFAMFDDLWAGSAGSEPPNAAPVAAFELETDELAVSVRSEEHTSELQSRENNVCRLLLEKK